VTTPKPNLSLTGLSVTAHVNRFHHEAIHIDNSTAHLIADAAITVDTPGLRQFARSGAIDYPAIAEVQQAMTARLANANPRNLLSDHPATSSAALTALLGYVLHHGRRAAVPTWDDDIKYCNVPSRHDDGSPHRQPETYPWGSEAGMAELIARQRADYAPAFTALLDDAESRLTDHLFNQYEPQPEQVPARGRFAGGMAVTLPTPGQPTRFAWTPADFAALIYGLRVAGIDSPTHREAARTMLTEIASLLGVTFTNPPPALRPANNT